jgi:hypothetical protein
LFIEDETNRAIHLATSAGMASPRNPMTKLSGMECPSVTGSPLGIKDNPDFVIAKANTAPTKAVKSSICQGSGFFLSIISMYNMKKIAGNAAAINRIIVVGSIFS